MMRRWILGGLEDRDYRIPTGGQKHLCRRKKCARNLDNYLSRFALSVTGHFSRPGKSFFDERQLRLKVYFSTPPFTFPWKNVCASSRSYSLGSQGVTTFTSGLATGVCYELSSNELKDSVGCFRTGDNNTFAWSGHRGVTGRVG
jgi:hypothetical protein